MKFRGPRGRNSVAVMMLATCAVVATACSESDRSNPSAPSSLAPAAGIGGAPSATYPSEDGFGPSVINFPPRDQPNAFFQNLIAYYRDVLRRSPSPTYVDPEGQNVWLTEYFRFYLNGCPHSEAMNRTLNEITTGGTQPACGAETRIFPPRNLPFEFQNQLEATYRDALRRSLLTSFVDSEGANVWLAQYLRFRVSGCDHLTAEAKVFVEIGGGGVQPDCSRGGTSVTGSVDPLGITRHPLQITGSGTTTMVLTLTWNNPNVDLDLYLTNTSCDAYPPTSCTILAASESDSGTFERLTRAARGGDRFFVWVDNFTNQAQTYTLSLGFQGFTTTAGDLEFEETRGISKPSGHSKRR